MTTRKPLVAGMIIGGVLTAAPVIGVLGTIFGMKRAFDTLGATSGIGDPSTVSGSVGGVLIATVGGIVLGIVGILLFTGCLIAFIVRGNQAPAGPDPAERPP